MATVVRLTRMGRNKTPFYRIVVTDSRKKRDGVRAVHVGLSGLARAPICLAALACASVHPGASTTSTPPVGGAGLSAGGVSSRCRPIQCRHPSRLALPRAGRPLPAWPAGRRRRCLSRRRFGASWR